MENSEFARPGLGASEAGDAEIEEIGEDPQATERGSLMRRLGRALVVIACYFVLEVVTKALVIVQFIYVAIRHRPEPRLQRLGAMLADFMGQTWRYCCFASDIPPWPFTRWPRGRLPSGVQRVR